MHIKVKVYPGAEKDFVARMGEDNFEIYVREPAREGLANKKVSAELGKIYKGKKVRLVSGHRSTNKIFSIEL